MTAKPHRGQIRCLGPCCSDPAIRWAHWAALVTAFGLTEADAFEELTKDGNR